MKLASDVQKEMKKIIRRLIIAVIILTLLLIGSNAFWVHKCSRINTQFTSQHKVISCQVRVPRQCARKKTA